MEIIGIFTAQKLILLSDQCMNKSSCKLTCELASLSCSHLLLLGICIMILLHTLIFYYIYPNFNS